MTLAVGAIASVAAVDRVPPEIVRALGTVRGKTVSTGLVFIDGKFLKPPYRVTRAGNQILVNDRPVTGQLVSWEKLLETQSPSRLKVTEVEVPDEPKASDRGDGSSSPAPEKDGVDPAAPKDGGNAPPPTQPAPAPSDDDDLFARVRIVETRYAADADDLDDFKPAASDKMKLSDIPADTAEDKARQKRAEDEKKEEEEDAKEEDAEASKEEGSNGASSAIASGKDENGDDVDPASPEGEAAAKAKEAAAKKTARPAGRTRKVTSLDGRFELNFRAQKYVKAIDAYRARIEAALRRGGYIFFGTNPARKYCLGLRTDAATTNELLKKLPELMGRAETSEGFCDAARTAGLMSYINLQIAQDLFRHKVDSIYLKQRRREIAEAGKLKKMMSDRSR